MKVLVLRERERELGAASSDQRFHCFDWDCSGCSPGKSTLPGLEIAPFIIDLGK